MEFNRNIKNFHVKGEAADQETVLRLRKQIEDHLEDEMREKGYVPSLDITPEIYWSYNEETEKFNYVIVKYGAFVGKRKAKKMLGLLGPHPIMKEPYSGE